MCGINGIFAYHYAANPIDAGELIRTRDRMIARGPDGEGRWISEDRRIGFGHRRLAVIDLTDAGAQPMASADGRLIVAYNGEIYNYRELRGELEAKGHRFRSHSDTEVLLHLYAAKGPAMAHDLRGMFAFAIWDGLERTLFLARDPYGIKPLYYADDGWTFRFASQVKALLAGGAISRDPEPAGLAGFYLFGSVPEPFTNVAGVRCLPAGSTMIVDATGAREPRRYHSIAATWRDARSADVEANEARAAIAGALRDSVAQHLVSDVPVGAFLSAGVDSGALVGLMRDAGARDIKTVTVAFEEFRGQPRDEAPLAEDVARHYGTDHATRIVTRAEFESDLPKILEAMDQPSIDGVNTWFAAKAARERGLKVVVSGLGGDELFGGYPSFRDIPRWVRMFAAPARVPFLGATARRIAQRLTGALGLNPKAAGLLEYGGRYAGAYLLKRGLFMPWELDQALDRDMVETGLRRLAPERLIQQAISPAPSTAFGCVAALESSLYMRNQLLRDTDWAGMAHSLEVRTPLVDSVLLERVASLTGDAPGAFGKHVLSDAPSRPLPSHIAGRNKTGFTTPLEIWMSSTVQLGSMPIKHPPRQSWARIWSNFIGDNSRRPDSDCSPILQN